MADYLNQDERDRKRHTKFFCNDTVFTEDNLLLIQKNA